MIGCLIIHGYTGGPHEVKPLSQYLEQRTNWEIVVPTLPGHGEELELKNVSHEKWLQAAEDSLKELKARNEKVFLIGFSMGGMIAAYLAGKFKVDKLVLLATAGKYFSFRQFTIDIGDIITGGVKGKIKKNRTYIRYKSKLTQIPFTANIEFFKLVKYTRGYLKKIKSPVFIAQGCQDETVPLKTASYLDREIASERKEIVLFEQSKHFICLGEDKDTLNTMVYDFLNAPTMEGV